MHLDSGTSILCSRHLFPKSIVAYMSIFIAISLLCLVKLYIISCNSKFESQIDPLFSDNYLKDVYKSGLRRLTAKAHSEHCRGWIEYEFMKHIRAIAEESPLPFEDVMFHTQCPDVWAKNPPLLPLHVKEAPPSPMTPPPPPRLPTNTTLYPDEIAILYVVLVHGNAKFAIRLINALNEKNHTFVIHVDLKAQSAYNELSLFADKMENVYMLQIGRQDAVWGAFSIVNATLAAMKFGMELGRRFDYMIDISGSSYPIKSNRAIRKQLAERPNAIYMDVQDEPNRPSHDLWYHYVECDGALHRIGRLPLVRGINMHIGSQWFAIPKHVMVWYLEDPLPQQYIYYCQHVVVADENYFSTLLKNSPYCGDLIPKNLLFLLFDKYENEKYAGNENATAAVGSEGIEYNNSRRDNSKCLGPDPNHCGRSPTFLTMSYKKLLEVSRALFARKFEPNNPSSMELVDLIDKWRSKDEEDGGRRQESGDIGRDFMIMQNQSFQPVSSTQSQDEPLCWELTDRHHMTMNFCNPSDPRQLFQIGPCTENALITINNDTHCQEPHEEETEMYCQIQSAAYDNICIDIDGENIQPGSQMIGWECSGQWNQLFRLQSNCTISAVQPELISRIRGFNDVNITRCLQTNMDRYSSKYIIETAECNKWSNNQRFHFLKRDNYLVSSFQETKRRKIVTPSPESSIPSSIPTPLQFLMWKSYNTKEEQN